MEEVLIIGAGPVGLTLANEMVRHGVKPRVIDASPGIREISKAMILHVRTQEVLDKVGIAGSAVSQAEPLTEVVVHAYGKHIGSWNLDGIESPYPHPVIIGQNHTQHLLLDHLQSQGCTVEWNTEATAVSVDDTGTTIELTHNHNNTETVKAKYVVGCEGSNSVVRKSLGFTFEGERYAGEQFIQADCKISWGLPSGKSYLFLTATGYLMVIEFPDGMVRVFISLPDSETSAGSKEAAKQLGAVEARTEEPTLEEIEKNLIRLSGYECKLSNATWLARYRTSHRYTNCFSKERAFLAGDAAHVHVPIGGQGMNTGIQDAFNLGWKLAGVAKGVLRPTVLESYHTERYPVAKSLIRGTDLAYKGILHPSSIRQKASRLFGPSLIKNNSVQEFMRSTLEELAIAYPNSMLNLDLGGGTGPAPGERVVDTPLVRSTDHTTVSLNELTRSPKWTLLIFTGIAGVDKTQVENVLEYFKPFNQVSCLTVVADQKDSHLFPSSNVLYFDFLNEAHNRYGVTKPTLYLLRPDTFVSARVPIEQWDVLHKHLQTIVS